MVRETRYLWVGNLPENIREDRIREHFKRYGRVQSVKLLPRGEVCPVDGGSSGTLGEGNEGGSGSSSGGSGGGGGGGGSSSSGVCATVAFMDIKSAAKAHAIEHTLDDRVLTAQYYEPQHLQHRFPSHGSSEDHGSSGGSGGGSGGTGGVSGGNSGSGSTGSGIGVGGGGERGERGSENFDSRGSHGSFYGSERSNRVVGAGSGGVVGGGGSGGGGGVVGGHPADSATGDPSGYISRRPPPASSYHVTSSRARDRLYPRTGPYVSGPPPPPHLDRHRGSLPPSSWSSYEPTSSRYGSGPPPPSPATNDSYQDEQGGGGGGGSSSSGTLRQHKKQRRKSRSGSSSPSGSSRSGSSSSSRSGSSGGSTSGGSTSPGSSPHRTSNVSVIEDRRPIAICVRNLPIRSSDSSLKDGLFHEYKKHGKVTWVKVIGTASDRYALVCFRKPEDVEKALEVSQDKLFFGCKIEVAPYQGYDVEDNEFRPYEAELDEYHPKATRTLFIGNLEKDVTASELRKHFEQFGEIIEIDIKKQGAVSSYAFCQYSDIGSVVKAMRSMDGEHLGANRIKLGFGKSMPTPCVWVDGIGDCTSEKFLSLQFNTFGPTSQVVVDRERGHALVFFDQISCAQAAVKEMRGVTVRGRRLQIDFASRECQETFYEHLERQGNTTEKPWDSRPSPASSFDIPRERNSFDSSTVPSSSNRFTRYDTPPRSRTTNYSRTSGGSTPGASPAHPTALSRSSRRSYQDSYYDGDYEPTSRRFRSYDEFSQGSGASHDDYQSSVLSDGKLNDEDCPPPSRRHAVQSVVTSIDPPAPPPPLLPPPDIRHLQKERVHLLEQLEECHSSGDEVGFVSKKRVKLDNSSTTILCEDEEPEIASLLVTSHSNRKGMDFRRVSDSKVVVHHSSRRGSCEGRGPGPCKRRRDATSRHHEHHDGSRPGTPLVDERPENLIPSEPRRFRERSHEGPLSLPLPRFAAQMLNNNNNTSSSNNNNGSGTRSNNASLSKIASPPCAASLSTAPSPRAAPQPPASPPPRHASSSPTSSDSETAPQSPSLEERIRSLDEKYEKWSGSRALSAAGGDALAKLDASASERFRFRHKLLDLDLHEVQPSDIVKSVLAKRSVFDEDSKRLENFSEKYEPREFTGVIGVSSMIGSTAGLTTSDGGCTSKVCLQYPFPSHPPIQPASGTSVTNQIGINTSLSASLTSTTTMTSSALKTDPRLVQHNCIHPTPATPITPGTSIKTVSPELPPVSLPIGLGSGTAASNNNGGSGLASASSLLSSNGSISNIHTLGTSTHRGSSISTTTASPTVTAASDAFNSTAITAVPVTTLSATTASATVATTTMSVTGAVSSMTVTSSIAPPSSITSSSNSSSSSSLSVSSTDLPRSRLRKESSGSNRDSRDSRDGKDSRESKHSKGKDCQRRSRKDETDVERNRKDKDEKESANVVNDVGNMDNHSKDFKDNKELRYERKEREEKERRDKEDRDRQERRDKEDRDRQEKKEKEERERREKDEERRERERLDKERQEKDRREREERERERKEREENELKEKERREKERIDRERREREEKERQERREREERERREREERERREREEREKKEREIRLEREKQEKERLRREREEQERREKEERERIERERRKEEKERLERERKREKEEKERLERERRKEKEEREKMEKEKREKEERERLEKLEKEKHEREKRREREDQERREKEKVEREKRRDREEKDKEKRERDESRRQSTENHLHPSVTQTQNQITPAPVPIKRRCSSQDCPTDEDIKRMKMSDHRRDSKDRSRQNRRSEDRKHRNDSHRSSRESRDSKESGSASQDTKDGESIRENNSKDSGSKEKQRSKKNRSEKESRERSPRVSHESDKEFLSRLELSKRNDSTLSTEQASIGSNHTRDAQQQSSTLNSHSDVDDGPLSTHEIQTVRNPSATDTDSDEPKKHSIFDIVDDEPAYISMYDKVKARSTKNMQKLEEEKRQVRLKDKFSQLKQSRARREEKKQSTSWDGDSVSSKALTEDEATSESDSTRTKSLSRKGSRSRIHSDTSEEEEPFNNKVRKPVKTERFLESDVDLGFADTEEKQNSLETSNVIVNSVHANIKEERTSDEDERISVSFRTNHPAIVVNNHERDSRKKSHKKKQKRQKNSISSEISLKVEPTETLEHKNKTNLITSSNADCRPNHGTELTTIAAATTIITTALENAEEKMRADKKQRSKKDKRRDRNGEDKAKARRKRLNRQEARDSQRMEDIFGPLSDDVDDGPSNTHTFFNRFSNITSENSVYASDSDGGRSSLDMDRTRRKTEKKRRHQPEDENSVDLAEAGREIEAKLLSMPSSPKAAPVCTAEPSDHDVFRFTDDNDSVEPSTPSIAPEKVKEKKKKRKKSKEERNRKDYHHHHHHHHHHHEKSGELPYLGAEPSPPRASSPLVSKTISSSLPTPRETLLSPIPKATSNVSTVSSITSPVVTDIQTKTEKKKDKFIPGFGIEIDETIHENAVKSISEPDEKDSNCQSRGSREEPEVPVSTTPPAQSEDKPRVAISQEETEDAVAALLEETFGASTEDFSYEGEEEEAETDGITRTAAEAPQEDVEEMQQAVESLNASTVEGDADLKPDTPQSEHDLQIDTDTEEDPNYETVDLTQPPKTPDIPSFYKPPTKITPVLTTPEKSIEVRLSTTVVAKPESSPSSVIAHSWTLNEHNKPRESVKSVQLETTESDVDVASPERTAQVQRTSASPPPPQYKQPMLVPCSVPITSEIPKSLSVSRPSPITAQPLYQRLPVSPQSQMIPMRQASPKMQTTTVSCSSSSNTTPLPPLVPSRIPPLVPSQSSPRISQPLSPNGQWSRNPTLSPHVPNVGKRKASPPPTKIAVCVPIPAHRPEAPIQQIYSTAATQQPVIQHASGMLAPTPNYPRGGLPPLTLNIPPRPYMPVPPLTSGIQVKNSRDSSLGGKSVIETLLPVNPNEPSQRLEEPKLSPAVIPEPINKASTSPKVPSPNQPPTYIPETAKIEINASTSSPVFGKPAYVTDSYTMSSRTQKQISITTDSNLLSPRQKQEVSNLQLLTTHVPRSSTPSPVIVAHGQSHLLHKSVHSLGPSNVSSSNQPLIKTVVPVVPQQITPSVPVPSDKSVIPQSPCQRQPPISQGQLVKSHIPLVSTESQTIITRVVSSTASSMSTPLMNECLDQRIQEQPKLEVDAEAQINQTVQPMQLTPPIQSTQLIDAVKQEPVDIKQEAELVVEEAEYNTAESEELLNQPCVEDDVKQEKQEVVIKTEILPCIPKAEVADTPAEPKLEAEPPVKLESVSEIKEEIKENDEMELDEEPVEDPLKEPSTDPLAIDSKEDPIDSKEDSDYWSAKEVNIESVIKKVDALCDGEGNDGDDETQQNESMNSDSHDNSKNESDWFDAESIEGESKKNFGSATDEPDEIMETCENESTKSRRGRAKRRGSRGGVTTRRGGRNASAVSHRRGGRSSRGSKHHIEKNKLPADVYEFHDDSEEDNAGRPRLILTIKSPGPNVTGPNAQPAIPVAAVKEIPPEEFVSPAANTRKSRRLAERDGSRSTVDDVIEDVVRGSPANKGLVSGAAGNAHATRRSTRHNNAPRNTTVQSATSLTTELRKSPRVSRKTARRTSENNEDSGEEKAKDAAVTQQEITIKEEPKSTQPESPKAEEPVQTVVTSTPQKAVSLEPMTLIDPVTGMLIPMRESEEGQYIPVSTASNQVQTINRTPCEPRSGGLVSPSPTNEAPRVKSEGSPLTAESKKEAVIEHSSSAPAQPIQPQTSVITKPQSPTVQVTSTITIAQSSTTTTTIVTAATATSVASTTTAQSVPTSQTKPTSFKAHVLNPSKLVTSTQQQVVITKPVAPSLPNQTIVQNIVKSPAPAMQGLNLQIPPGRVASPSLSPRAKQAAQLPPANAAMKQGQPMSPVLNNTGVPPNPKQHLLQAAKQQTPTIVNMPQKMPLNIQHSVPVNVNRMHQPVSQPTALKGINGQPHPLNPKTHLLQAVVPPIVTGSSSTQPHLVNPQPISTGSTRPPVPKTPAAGTMEPQKVEVPMSGCIMMPTASPQSRSVPMPTYEAPLHGSTGATPPGSQYGLVPPHRSQSPPLPPPAHHHVNTSQNEVVNHYGGLTRGGELPPHYLHSQMLQYQYHIRAQQEALTAPRIAYHIPGTRSPHLPLDPKLETGIEDSHSPPLELRRGTRTPQDRTTDSPQVAQVYMLHANVRLPPPPPQYNAGSNPSLPGTPVSARAGYYEPPPAHLRSQYPMAASEAPPEMGRATTPERCRKHHVVTPPPPYAQASQPQADTFQMLLQRYPVMWQGLLALKNDQAAVQMHFVFGNPNVARDSLPCNSDGSTPPLRIAQRMRLEQTQVEGVARKMQTDNEHCMLLALPCGRDEVDVLQQSKNLQTGFIMYLQQKQAAGIVNIAAPGSQQPAYVVHIFPSCDFAHENLARIAPDLLHRVAKIAHLLIVIATV